MLKLIFSGMISFLMYHYLKNMSLPALDQRVLTVTAISMVTLLIIFMFVKLGLNFYLQRLTILNSNQSSIELAVTNADSSSLKLTVRAHSLKESFSTVEKLKNSGQDIKLLPKVSN